MYNPDSKNKTESDNLLILFDIIENSTNTIYLMFYLINFIDLLIDFFFFAYSEFDGSNMFQRICDRGNKRLGKLWNAQRIPVWKTPQVNRLIGNR